MTSTATRSPAEAVRAIVARLDEVALGEALDVYDRIDGIVEAARSRRLGFAMSVAEEAGHDPHKAAKSAAGRGGKTSRRAAEAAAKRAGAVRANETLGGRLAAGELTVGQLDNIAHAAVTDVSAATDEGLIGRIAERSVDQGRRVANDWATEKTSAKALDKQHQRQRHNRAARVYWSREHDAMALTLYGDGPTIDDLWRQINAQERVEYRNDGGRDVQIVDHPRTRDQRRFDAAVAIFAGTAKAAAGRAAAVISIPWNKLCGDDPDTCVERVGYGPISDTAAIDALAKSDLFVNLTDLQGQTLWWGRAKRNADLNQFIALVLRDKGCVLCSADWQHSQAHHLMPWEAPGRGLTNINNLALVCSTCHHSLHNNHLTLYRHGVTGQWLTRAATPDEIAPNRPTTKPQTAKRRDPKRRPTNQRPAANEELERRKRPAA